jgi:signal transduction histidine kinase
VRLAHGRTLIDSVPGLGTTVTVVLPDVASPGAMQDQAAV